MEFKPKRRHDEHDFQVTAVEYCRLILPAGCILTSIDHAGGGRVAGAQRKRRGVVDGISDIYIAFGPMTVWLECKTRIGRLQPNQAAFRDLVQAQGHYWGLVRSLEEIDAVLQATAIPLRRVMLA